MKRNAQNLDSRFSADICGTWQLSYLYLRLSNQRHEQTPIGKQIETVIPVASYLQSPETKQTPLGPQGSTTLYSNFILIEPQRAMYGRKGYQLVKDFASGEKGQLKPFNSKLFDETIEECDQNHHLTQSLMRKMQQEGLDVGNNGSADHYGAGALIHHLSLIRNKRCLMAYVYNRAELVRDLAWRVGLELLDLPSEIQEKLTTLEKEYFKNHSVALKSYMGKVEIELNVDMVPPKDPYIKVRILDDIDEGIVLSDKTTNFACHSMHFLKRTDAEPYIARGQMEELTG